MNMGESNAMELRSRDGITVGMPPEYWGEYEKLMNTDTPTPTTEHHQPRVGEIPFGRRQQERRQIQLARKAGEREYTAGLPWNACQKPYQGRSTRRGFTTQSAFDMVMTAALAPIIALCRPKVHRHQTR